LPEPGIGAQEQLPMFLKDHAVSLHTWKFISEFPPASQSEYEKQVSEVRKLGVVQFAKLMAVMEHAFVDAVCQGGNLSCSVCQLPFANALEVRSIHTQGCANCETKRVIDRDLPSALQQLEEAVHSSIPPAGLEPFIARVSKFTVANYPLHVRAATLTLIVTGFSSLS
jgi:hypothetical protein